MLPRPCTDRWTADPAARVFGDRLYLYTSHDLAGKSGHYEMTDWLAFSTDDLRTWTAYGSFFSLDDIPWATRQAWAPDVVEHKGRYHFFYPVERTKIGLAVSDSPVEGFRDIGHPLVDNTGRVEEIGPEPIDPSVIVVDGKGYLFFGCRELRMIELDSTLTNVVGKVRRPVIRGIEDRKEGDSGWYGEAPFVFRRGDWFYLMYSDGWSKKSTLVYARSRDIQGPWDYVGPIMPHQGCSTSHGSIVEFKGKWYVFYHDCRLSGWPRCRSVTFREITFDDDAKLRVVEGTSGEPKVSAQ